MSESRRLARSLVEPEPVALDSRFPRDESIERLRRSSRAFDALFEGDRVVLVTASARLEARWQGADPVKLAGEFKPGRRMGIALQVLSLVFLLLVAASGWMIWATDTGAARFLLPLVTVLAVLAFPFIITGMASTGEADRARIRKALRVALQDEEERLPARKWDDED